MHSDYIPGPVSTHFRSSIEQTIGHVNLSSKRAAAPPPNPVASRRVRGLSGRHSAGVSYFSGMSLIRFEMRTVQQRRP